MPHFQNNCLWIYICPINTFGVVMVNYSWAAWTLDMAETDIFRHFLDSGDSCSWIFVPIIKIEFVYNY